MKRFVSSFLFVFLGCMALFAAQYAASNPRQVAPRVNVRWSETVTEPMREALEAQYRLADGTHDSGRTWSYQLLDAERENIRRLVQDPAVEDTHSIDRRTFQLTDERWWPLRPRWFALWSALIGIAVATLAARTDPEKVRRLCSGVRSSLTALFHRARSFVVRAVPDLSAQALGLFRIYWAAVLFMLLSTTPMTLHAGAVPFDGELGWAWLNWLASRPDLVELLRRATLTLLVCFGLGVFAQVAYLLAASGMAVWILVWIESQHSNAHSWLVMLLMVLCLVPVAWRDSGLSLEEVVRRRRTGHGGPGQDLHGKAYGFAVWTPGFILGAMWVSAAFAKLESSGLDWILGGAVKYHWVIDSEHAPVDWGLWVAAHHWAAVIMSFCGVFLEAVFIGSVFVTSWRWRLAFTGVGFGLLTGFYLFQGVFWLPWWVVLISFGIPWAAFANLLTARAVHPMGALTPISSLPRVPPGRDLRHVHGILIVLLCVHAIFKLPAGFGRFTAYSNTYPSTDAFDSSDALDPVDRVWLGYGTPDAVEVPAEAAKQAILTLIRHEPLSSGDVQQVRHLDSTLDTSVKHRRLTLTRSRPIFDWNDGRFRGSSPALVVGTLDLTSVSLVPE